MENEFKIGDSVYFNNMHSVICHFINAENRLYIAQTRFACIYIYERNQQITVATELLKLIK
ncbi:MAG TPA: hypothetical protein DCR77_06285 [Flavobacteriaceae bacterium]|nr:hypothetical protein [Flavobacteriaceae bacterium]